MSLSNLKKRAELLQELENLSETNKRVFSGVCAFMIMIMAVCVGAFEKPLSERVEVVPVNGSPEETAILHQSTPASRTVGVIETALYISMGICLGRAFMPGLSSKGNEESLEASGTTSEDMATKYPPITVVVVSNAGFSGNDSFIQN